MKSDFSRFLHHTLSHSDLIGVPKSNKFANWFHLDYRVKPDDDRKRKDASLKPECDGLCTGRSMVEMLGVLAIIGVLSVGAIAGYSKAMMKYKLNQHAQAVNMLINNFLQLGEQLSIGQNEEVCYGTLFKKMNLLPDGINYRYNCELKDSWFNGSIKIYRNTIQNQNFGGLCFFLPVSSQGEDICRNILFVAKENAANLWAVELVNFMSDSSIQYSKKNIYGNNYCSKDRKCLYNMTLNDTEVVCNVCDGEECALCVFSWYK